MSLVVTKVNPPTEPPDQYGNISYWVQIQGHEGGVIVRHKGSTPMLMGGQDATLAGWNAIEPKVSKAGKPYGKLTRDHIGAPSQTDAPWQPSAPQSAPAVQRQELRGLDAVSRSIAAQHAQKVAFEIIALATKSIPDARPSPPHITEQVRVAARALFEQVVELGEDRPVLPAAESDVPF